MPRTCQPCLGLAIAATALGLLPPFAAPAGAQKVCVGSGEVLCVSDPEFFWVPPCGGQSSLSLAGQKKVVVVNDHQPNRRLTVYGTGIGETFVGSVKSGETFVGGAGTNYYVVGGQSPTLKVQGTVGQSVGQGVGADTVIAGSIGTHVVIASTSRQRTGAPAGFPIPASVIAGGTTIQFPGTNALPIAAPAACAAPQPVGVSAGSLIASSRPLTGLAQTEDPAVDGASPEGPLVLTAFDFADPAGDDRLVIDTDLPDDVPPEQFVIDDQVTVLAPQPGGSFRSVALVTAASPIAACAGAVDPEGPRSGLTKLQLEALKPYLAPDRYPRVTYLSRDGLLVISLTPFKPPANAPRDPADAGLLISLLDCTGQPLALESPKQLARFVQFVNRARIPDRVQRKPGLRLPVKPVLTP